MLDRDRDHHASPHTNPVATLKLWWDQPDGFDSVTVFLRSRGWLRATHAVLFLVGASSVLAPVALWVQLARLGVAGQVLLVVSSLYSVANIAVWTSTVWPTRRQSVIFVLCGALEVGVLTIIQPSPALAALGCTALVVTGTYYAFFHNTRLVLANCGLAAICAAVAAWRLSLQTSPALAVTAFWLIVLVTHAVPVLTGLLARAMMDYAEEAHRDALTGLFNRRGFSDAAAALVATTAEEYVVVMLIDLDRFKQLNDTYGHVAGDRTLVTIATLLQTHLPHAVSCRSGGEEFLVAYLTTHPGPAADAQRVCMAIDALADQTTASIGAVTARVTDARTEAGLEALIMAADSAMYSAKRLGGNQVRHAATVNDVDPT